MRKTVLQLLPFLAVFVAVLLSMAGCSQRGAASVPASRHSDAAPANNATNEATSNAADQVAVEAVKDEAPAPVIIEPFEGIRVLLHEPSIEIRSWVCIDGRYDGNFLEQIACSPGTREHESLVVVEAAPSDIHAALLLAGFEPGAPGRWAYDHEAPEGEQLKLIAPTGQKLEVFARYQRDGETVEEPIRNWVRDFHDLDRRLPDEPWVFGGSMFRENPDFMGPGEHYVADMTGSIIGLVTFGDEVIGFREVISDQAAIHEPEWEVDSERIPPIRTEVTLILRPFE